MIARASRMFSSLGRLVSARWGAAQVFGQDTQPPPMPPNVQEVKKIHDDPRSYLGESLVALGFVDPAAPQRSSIGRAFAVVDELFTKVEGTNGSARRVPELRRSGAPWTDHFAEVAGHALDRGTDIAVDGSIKVADGLQPATLKLMVLAGLGHDVMEDKGLAGFRKFMAAIDPEEVDKPLLSNVIRLLSKTQYIDEHGQELAVPRVLTPRQVYNEMQGTSRAQVIGSTIKCGDGKSNGLDLENLNYGQPLAGETSASYQARRVAKQVEYIGHRLAHAGLCQANADSALWHRDELKGEEATLAEMLMRAGRLLSDVCAYQIEVYNLAPHMPSVSSSNFPLRHTQKIARAQRTASGGATLRSLF